MTDSKDQTTGDKIIKAREEERQRIMQSRPDVSVRVGWSSPIHSALPLVEIKITGGDPEKSHALGRDLLASVLTAFPDLAAPTQSEKRKESQ